MRIKPFLAEVKHPAHICECVGKLEYGREIFDHHVVKCYDIIFVDTEIEAVEGDLCFDVNLNKTFIIDANRIDSFKKTSKRWAGLPKNFYKIVLSTNKSHEIVTRNVDGFGNDLHEPIPQLSKVSITSLLFVYNENGEMPEWVEVKWKTAYQYDQQGSVDITIPTPLLSRALDQDASKSLSKILLEGSKRSFTPKDMNDFAQWYFENMGKLTDDYLALKDGDYLDIWLKEK